MLRDAERTRPRDYDMEEAMLQRARDALFRFATESTAGYSNARFLSLQRTALGRTPHAHRRHGDKQQALELHRRGEQRSGSKPCSFTAKCGKKIRARP